MHSHVRNNFVDSFCNDCFLLADVFLHLAFQLLCELNDIIPKIKEAKPQRQPHFHDHFLNVCEEIQVFSLSIDNPAAIQQGGKHTAAKTSREISGDDDLNR
jgi:hypothetical protein